MISYEEAKKKALDLKPTATVCTETNDAYIFICKDDPDSDGGVGPCVIQKDTGRAISITAYYTDKMATGEKVVELREFDI